MTFAIFICVSNNVFVEDLAILLHEWLHRELYEHFVGVLFRRSLHYLFLAWDVVVFAPHEFLQRHRIHSKLLADSTTNLVKCEAPVVQSRGEAYIAFFRRVQVFLLSCFKFSVCQFIASAWIVWWWTSVSLLIGFFLAPDVFPLNQLGDVTICVFNYVHNPLVYFLSVHPLIDDKTVNFVEHQTSLDFCFPGLANDRDCLWTHTFDAVD